ncbi:response regulator transcription factor [Alicyclobacillus tolerans]|uniref:DNA-binding response regulator, OmpR family, contains REC and winged-helix (WHTH) domain n=2 Tax=Alicyclobacillus tolerans TaxID=90970 RepID=A0A1M6W2E8_9BACL|nr:MULTISPECIES: response regulator transcription factor [Alicyclobacillus]MDP9729108.1 DNA-binding response OmpR family regulator [Alicyclobacillus tengchongensis]QRF24203.1 response regulator transcription factor [Alicyclobacillus sp. TC]SHK87924.1 DNA-binding response regulator, OmpR family, contains REC and winged-helix (wHTH) domain [Alicyclobacillus montanus]
MSYRLLIVDDEPKVVDVMRSFLEGEGFLVEAAYSGTEALHKIEQSSPDLVVLDWMLPGMSGLEVCRELRKSSNIGIIMVTAKSEEADKVVGLEVGADDYLAKPFSLRELSARIKSILRRMGGEFEEERVLERGDIRIDVAKYQVWKGNQEVQLTPTEFKILLTLAEKPGVVYTRLQLLKAAMGEEYLNYERTVDTHISHVRQKLEDSPAQPVYIQTVYGIGYRFGEAKA